MHRASIQGKAGGREGERRMGAAVAARRSRCKCQLRTYGQLLVLQCLNVDAPPCRLQQLPQPLDTHGGGASGGAAAAVEGGSDAGARAPLPGLRRLDLQPS